MVRITIYIEKYLCLNTLMRIVPINNNEITGIKMCESNKTDKAVTSGRMSIWDIPEYQLCTVVGTCLDLNHLRKLKNRFMKFGLDMPLKSNYDLHACCVSVCRNRNWLSRAINKTINQQFSRQLQEVRSLQDDEAIRSLWQSRESEDMQSLAGYYWAIITSHCASSALKEDIYGEVHMISHISGQNSVTSLHEREMQIQQMRFELQKKDRTIARRNMQIDQIRRVSEGLENQLRNLIAQKTKKNTELEKSKKSPEVYEQVIDSQMGCIDRLQTRVDKQKQEISDLRLMLQQQQSRSHVNNAVNSPKAPAQESANTNAGASDLCGKKILYVGGYARHRNKFQRFTEKINGCFLYHDGGVQQSVYQLDELVKRADAVFCPVDCISHGAVDRIKSISRRECKDCVFLRNASLSSYRSRVTQYAARN